MTRGKFTIPSGFHDHGDLKTQTVTEFCKQEEYDKHKEAWSKFPCVRMKTKCPECGEWVFWGTTGALPTTMQCNSCDKEFYYLSEFQMNSSLWFGKDNEGYMNYKPQTNEFGISGLA